MGRSSPYCRDIWRTRCCLTSFFFTARRNARIASAVLATKARIANRKKMFSNRPTSSTCPHNMANFGPLTAEIGSGVWDTPANFNGFRVFASLLQPRRSPEANQTLHESLTVSWAATLYIFGGSCPLPEFCQLQNSLRPSLVFLYILAALLHGTRAAAISQTLWRGTRNGIREFSQREPPIFGWAAITLGIGLHSSWS